LKLLKKVSCSHCKLEFDKSIMIKDKENYFCCNGCKIVYKMISNKI